MAKRIKIIYKSILFVALSMALFGCLTHLGPQIDHEKLDQLVIGKTTKSEVIAIFGSMPTSQTRSGATGMTTLT